jgi:Flp pilus assembly protein TadD
MRKVRALSAEARPARASATTLESTRPGLAAAAAAAAFAPSSETLRAAAAEYARAGVNDRAFEYLNRSIALAPREAAGYDALARLWRDSGFPQLGLGDAYRAVYYAPASAIAHNTLGTMLQTLGHRDAARREYERALGLEPTAVYALNNLCYGFVLAGEGRHAVGACEKALSVDPDFAPARHNLALAFAVAGNISAARRTFDANSDRAEALYNIGIVHLARREYRDAIKAFETVQALRPGMRLATARLRQSQAAIERGVDQ